LKYYSGDLGNSSNSFIPELFEKVEVEDEDCFSPKFKRYLDICSSTHHLALLGVI
jgi:hypothetical protein